MHLQWIPSICKMLCLLHKDSFEEQTDKSLVKKGQMAQTILNLNKEQSNFNKKVEHVHRIVRLMAEMYNKFSNWTVDQRSMKCTWGVWRGHETRMDYLITSQRTSLKRTSRRRRVAKYFESTTMLSLSLFAHDQKTLIQMQNRWSLSDKLMDNFKFIMIPWSQRRLETLKVIRFPTKTLTTKCLLLLEIQSQHKTI
jgi:hypothetical protein